MGNLKGEQKANMLTPGRVFVGCAGWSFPHWNGPVYPKPRPRSFEPLTFLASRFDTVEISSTFYRPAESQTTERWLHRIEQNPNFVFTAKLGRQFTHDRLTAATAVDFFKKGLWPLYQAGRLGALLMQFPPEFRFTPPNRQFARTLRRTFYEFPIAIDTPHESWEHSDAIAFVRELRVGLAGERTLTGATGYRRVTDPSADIVSVAAQAARLARLADRYFVIFTGDLHGASFLQAAALRALLTGEPVAPPAQARLDFTLPVA